MDGFKEYDSCDLHIRFRVHAHIYNLSHGNTTLLINEDARGSGVNDALGIANINIGRNLSRDIIEQIHFLKSDNGGQYVESCMRIRRYFKEMQNYILDVMR